MPIYNKCNYYRFFNELDESDDTSLHAKIHLELQKYIMKMFVDIIYQFLEFLEFLEQLELLELLELMELLESIVILTSFLAVQDSSIGDLVSQSVSQSVSESVRSLLISMTSEHYRAVDDSDKIETVTATALVDF